MQQVVDSYCIFSFVDQNRPFGLISAPKETERTVPLVYPRQNKPEEPSLWFNIFILSFVVI